MKYRELPDAFAYEKISVYKLRGRKLVGSIILTDQLLLDVPPASHILNPVTFLDDNATNLGPDGRQFQVSARRELISWVQDSTPDKVRTMFDDQEQLALRPVLKMVERNSIMFQAHANQMMRRILVRHCDTQFPDSNSFFLQLSRSLHRIIHAQQATLRDALRMASFCGGDDIAEQKQDFLANDFSGMLKALEEDVRFLVGEASIQEGKVVAWMSKFAALFLPVSLLATIPGFVGGPFGLTSA